MNRLIFLVAAIAVLGFTLGVYSCAKDESKNEQDLDFATENRNGLAFSY